MDLYYRLSHMALTLSNVFPLYHFFEKREGIVFKDSVTTRQTFNRTEGNGLFVLSDGSTGHFCYDFDDTFIDYHISAGVQLARGDCVLDVCMIYLKSINDDPLFQGKVVEFFDKIMHVLTAKEKVDVSDIKSDYKYSAFSVVRR